MTLASDVIRPSDLDEDCFRQWESIRRGQPSLSGPYFTPQFVSIVGKVRPRTRVAVIRDAGVTIGFFPFELGRMRRGHPVARTLSDFHGPILSQECGLNANELLQLSGLRAWTFDHLVSSDRVFRACATADCASPTIDLSDGVEAYFSERHQAERRHFKQLDYCSRRIIRDYPDIEFTMESQDSTALRQLMEWKSEQCRRSELPDVFGVEWTRNLLELILTEDDENFAGQLSTIRHGDTLVAAHFGMRTRDVLHYWFPTYNHSFSRYSPGLLLLSAIARHADSRGYSRIDLGKGDDAYKSRVANSHTEVREGCAELRCATATAMSLARRLDQRASSSRWMTPLALPGRIIRKYQRLTRHH